MVALPGQLFFNTQIPACLWFLTKEKRTRRGEVLFIDARKLATMISRVQCEMTDALIERMAATAAAWRGATSAPRRVLVTFADEAASADTALSGASLSEPALAADWLRDDEDEAWAHLQCGQGHECECRVAAFKVAALQAGRTLLIEDGNHGENRPRAEEFAMSGVASIR